MCAIIGALLHNVSYRDIDKVNAMLRDVFAKSTRRGRDGIGWTVVTNSESYTKKNTHPHDVKWSEHQFFTKGFKEGYLIANLRAEPTTEYVKEKSSEDQQPYEAGDWIIVHNGTIANDKDLRTDRILTTIDSAAIAEHLDSSFRSFPRRDDSQQFEHFVDTIEELKGSYAILATRPALPGCIYTAANYRPIWYVVTEYGFVFASSRDFFSTNYIPQMLPAYSAHRFAFENGSARHQKIDLTRSESNKTLVVCSGGLDSVVAATYAQQVMHRDIHLIHFMYGSRAEGPEVKAVEAVAERLGVPYTLFPLPVYKKSDSPLLDSDSKVAGGEEGAEFAHEWVPARNLLLLSVATAFAEANGFTQIVLGNNLEEAGAYPDNEPEFINRFNDLLPFAVADGKQMEVRMPVGNLMKHEIVKLGLELGAPLDLTWSCYRAGSQHCGTCGPCFMRRTAFEINDANEVITYLNQEPHDVESEEIS